MERPHVICHMTVSIDGKVTGDFLGSDECVPATEIYYMLNRDFVAEAFACGRVTMEESFTGGWFPDLDDFKDVKIAHVDYIADTHAERYAVAFDRKGSLGWKVSHLEDADPGYNDCHIVEILTEEVDDAYLAYLQKTGISYIFAGKRELNLGTALEKLTEYFGIQNILLEGGSVLNEAFLRADLIDELSIVQAPVVAGENSKSLFGKGMFCDFRLKEVHKVKGVLWIRYER